MTPAQTKLLAAMERGAIQHIVWDGEPFFPDSGPNSSTIAVKTSTIGTVLRWGSISVFKDKSKIPGALKAHEMHVLFEGGRPHIMPIESEWSPLEVPSREEVKRGVEEAVSCLLRFDRALLRMGVAERTITARLGHYLQEEFPAWHVDCEYNRVTAPHSKHFAKHLDAFLIKNATSIDKVYPDVIIHKRMTACNLVVLEAKKRAWGRKKLYETEKSKDLDKLSAFHEQLGYRDKIFVSFRGGPSPDLHELIFLQRNDPPTLFGTYASAPTPDGNVVFPLRDCGILLLSGGGDIVE